MWRIVNDWFIVTCTQWILNVKTKENDFDIAYYHFLRSLCVVFRPPVRSNGRSYKMLVMFFISFASFSPPSLDRSPWNFATWSETGGLDKLSPKIRGALLPQKWGGQNMQNFRHFLPLLTLIANIFGTDHHVKSLKIPLSTTSHSTLGQKNLVNFGPQTTEWKWLIMTNPSGHFSGDYISALRGCCILNFYTR